MSGLIKKQNLVKTVKPTNSEWSLIEGDIANQTDLVNELNGKEDSLGNPDVDGKVLSSTSTGERSWIPMSGGGTAEGIAIAFSLDINQAASHSINNPSNNPLCTCVYKNSESGVITDESIDFSNGDESYYLFEELADGTVSVNGNILTKDSGTFHAKIKTGVLININGQKAIVVELTDTSHIKLNHSNLGILNNVNWSCHGLKLEDNKLVLSGANYYIPEYIVLYLRFNAFTNLDSSLNNASFTLVGNDTGKLALVTGKFNSAFNFNPPSFSGGYMYSGYRSDINPIANNSAFTIEFWIRRNNTTMSGHAFIFHSVDGTDYIRVIANSTNQLIFDAETLAGNLYTETTISSMNTTTFTHVCYEYHGGNICVMENGILRTKTSGNLTAFNSSNVRLVICANKTLADFSNIALDDMRVYNISKYGASAFNIGNTVFTPDVVEWPGVSLALLNDWYYVETEKVLSSAFWSKINTITITGNEDANVSVKYAVKFNNNFKVWDVNTSEWTIISLEQISTNGMTKTELNALTDIEIQGTGGFNPNNPDYISVGIAAFATSYTIFEIDKISINYDLAAKKQLLQNESFEVFLAANYSRIEFTNKLTEPISGTVVIK